MSVIFTVFAGRERYMKLLIPYIEKLNVTEVHIWDFTRTESDAQYIQNSCQKFKIFSVIDKSTYAEYYSYYTKSKYPNPMDVIIKCDDDIVFIDVDSFDAFIDARRKDPAAFLYSANIVNNPVCTLVSTKRGIYSETLDSKVDTETPPEFVHNDFLQDPSYFISKCKKAGRLSELTLNAGTYKRFNINFIAILAQDLDFFESGYIRLDDELFLGTFGPLAYMRNVVIDIHFVVSHMAYTKQRENGYDETDHLERYSRIDLNSSRLQDVA
jgi:hypothetical protein